MDSPLVRFILLSWLLENEHVFFSITLKLYSHQDVMLHFVNRVLQLKIKTTHE